MNKYYKSLFKPYYSSVYANFLNKDVAIQTDEIDIEASKDVVIQTDEINIEASKDVVIQTDEINIEASKDVAIQTDEINIEASKDVVIQTDEINIEASKDVVIHIDEINIEIFDDNLPLIIGITGKKFNGKDTLGNYLSKYGYKRMAFADPLKEVLRTVFHFNDEQLYGEDKEKPDEYWKIAPRTVMQFVGTDLFRHQINKILPNIGNNIWIEVIKRQIIEIWKTNPKQKIVMTDLRFPNEINLIKELNGTIIRVKRNIDKNYNDFVVIHESETYIDTLTVDYDFENNSSKPDLFKKFDDLYKLNI